jgi:hypothetical protein
MRERLGSKKVIYRSGILAIDGPVPVGVLRSHPSAGDQPASPEELARWVNCILRLKPHKGVSKCHPGIERLSRWVVNRLSTQNRSIIGKAEMLGKARQWLPEYFEGVVVDPESLHATYKVETIDVEVDHEWVSAETDRREEKATEFLVDTGPKRRIKGLSILVDIEDPDLFDWCLMFLDDESVEVRLSALHTMALCEDGDADSIAPLVEASDRRIRGAAIAAVARHSGRHGMRWVEYGLKDPSPCVRVETAKVLVHFDPEKHREIFRLALHDPNREVSRIAEKLTAGKGYHKITPRLTGSRRTKAQADRGRAHT